MTYNPNIHHRRSVRLIDYDYSQEGLYFVTICVQKWQCIFGGIVDNEMILNKYGQIAHDEWTKTPEIRSNVQLDVFVVMPNHIHGIIIINENIRDTCENTRRGVSHTPTNNGGVCNTPISNKGVSHTPANNGGVCNTPISNGGVCNTPISNKGVCNTPLRSPSNTIGAIIRGYKSAVSKQLGRSIWQRNYWEHIIRSQQSHQIITDYIINNPSKWENDRFYTET